MTDFKHYEDQLKDHRLEEVPTLPDGKIRAFYLRPAGGGRMMSTLLLFTPEGIVIQGDLRPTSSGACSCYGYSLEWFSGHLSPSYLAEKFLRTTWVPEEARDVLLNEDFRGHHDGLTNDEVGQLRDLANWLDSIEYGGLIERLRDITNKIDWVDWGIGITYHPGEQGWLVAIQRRFAALYAEYQAERRETAEVSNSA